MTAAVNDSRTTEYIYRKELKQKSVGHRRQHLYLRHNTEEEMPLPDFV